MCKVNFFLGMRGLTREVYYLESYRVSELNWWETYQWGWVKNIKTKPNTLSLITTPLICYLKRINSIDIKDKVVKWY